MRFRAISKAGALLMISAVLVACTVVDLDENGKTDPAGRSERGGQ